MKLFRRAQTATEYMIILAVIIIIALIVVGVMGGIPGLGGGARGRAQASYWQTADIGVTAFSSIVGTTGTIKLRNNLRDTISITEFALDGTNVSGLTSPSVVLAPGETQTFSLTGIPSCAAAGDSFTYDVSVNYTDDETGATYEFTGEGNKLEGTCAAS